MKTFKSVLGWLSLWLFRVFVSLAVTFAALVAVLGNPGNFKTTLSDSGIYENVVDGVLVQISEESTGIKDQDLSLSDPELRDAATSAFTPELLQNSAESFIDGFYSWLDGTANDLSFVVDLTDAKEDLAAGVAEYAGKRLKSLPPCELGQITAEFDPLAAKCRPPVDISEEQKKLANELASSDEFLPETHITEEDLPKGKNGESFAEANSSWPDKYRFAKSLPLILVLGALLSSGFYILLNEDRKTGIKRVAKALLATCAMLVISTLIFLFVFNRVHLINLPNPEFQESLVMLLKNLTFGFAKMVFIWCTVLSVGSVTILLAIHRSKSLQSKNPKT